MTAAPNEECSCGHPLHTKRLTLLGVFTSCAHCDGPCYLGALCRYCTRIWRAAKPA